jgi:hypothetical protein
MMIAGTNRSGLTPSLTHSLTHSFTHSLIHFQSLTHSLTHIHSLTHSHIHSLTLTFTHSSHSLHVATHPLTTHSLTRSLVDPLAHSFNPSLTNHARPVEGLLSAAAGVHYAKDSL